MIAHSAALRYIFARKITAAEHSALSYTVKCGGAGGGVLRTVLTVSVNRYHTRSIGAVAQNMAEGYL